jgi:hypothetical protein
MPLASTPIHFVCEPKSPRFFTANWEKRIDWYKSHLKASVEYRAVGEASPSYTKAPQEIDVSRRMYDTLGDIKYIYIARHPIDRIVSNYHHAVVYQWTSEGNSFQEAFKQRPSIKSCSLYYYQIEQYLTLTSAR